MKLADIASRTGARPRQPVPAFDNKMQDVYDAPQAAYSFVSRMGAHIERETNAVQYEGIDYQTFVPLDFSAGEWAPIVEYYSLDLTGKAQFLGNLAADIPNADIKREQHTVAVHMAGIGYSYTLQEIGLAQRLGQNLRADKAIAARRAYEEFMQNAAYQGDTSVNFTGLFNSAAITPANVALNAGATSRLWSAKTTDEILTDLNDAIAGVWSTSKGVEMANTIMMSYERLSYLSSKPRADGSDYTILKYFRENNIYTLKTGKPLLIGANAALSTAGDSSTQRMVVYARDPMVCRMHVPMPHRFLQPFQKTALEIEIPGIFRLGGFEIRRPGAFRYRDGF